MSLPHDAAPADALHPRALARFPEQMTLATDLLRKPPALIGLTEAEARCVASAMQLIDYPKGARLMRENDRTATGYMLLLLEGEVSVELEDADRPEGVAISVLGPGALLGEMSLIDGEPRSSNVTALTPVQVAGLSRKGLELIIDQQPRVAAKLLAEVAGIIANRLRALSDQLRMYAQLAESQQREIERLRRGG